MIAIKWQFCANNKYKFAIHLWILKLAGKLILQVFLTLFIIEHFNKYLCAYLMQFGNRKRQIPVRISRKQYVWIYTFDYFKLRMQVRPFCLAMGVATFSYSVMLFQFITYMNLILVFFSVLKTGYRYYWK